MLAEASDLEEPDDFAATQSFTDAWLMIALLQRQAEEAANQAQRYQRFLNVISVLLCLLSLTSESDKPEQSIFR
jgi:hypothetical protein